MTDIKPFPDKLFRTIYIDPPWPERDTIKLACKQTENSILRSELRRMFQLYVAAEMRADTGVSAEERDDD